MPTHCPGGSICHSAEKLILGLSDVKKYRMDDIVQCGSSQSELGLAITCGLPFKF